MIGNQINMTEAEEACPAYKFGFLEQCTLDVQNQHSKLNMDLDILS
jgi:hypothetical protein